MAKNRFGLLRSAHIVFQKDIHLEFRTRYSINAILMFAITTLTAISFSIGPMNLRSEVLSPLLWILLFFSSMSGLSHIFVREEEQQTADTLRLVTSPASVFLGKWFFNIVLLFGLEVIIVPLFLAMMGAGVEGIWIFLLILFIGSIGLASVATIIAAIISQASAKGALFAVVSFPISLPILISGIHGTRLAMDGVQFSDCLSDLQVLISFSIVIVTLSLLLFEFIWRK
ncbi:MAG: heme exporter protein CcmB [Calditrichia bacterium]